MAKTGATARSPAGAVDRHDEIDLVLGRQAFHRLDRLGRLAAVVVLDHLDLALAGLELEPAAIVDLLRPELEVRPVGDRGARGHEAGSRSDHADPHGVLGIGGAGAEQSRERSHGDKCQRCSSVHSILPVGFAWLQRFGRSAGMHPSILPWLMGMRLSCAEEVFGPGALEDWSSARVVSVAIRRASAKALGAAIGAYCRGESGGVSQDFVRIAFAGVGAGWRVRDGRRLTSSGAAMGAASAAMP